MDLQKSKGCPEVNSRNINLGRPYVKFLGKKRLIANGVATPFEEEVIIKLQSYLYSPEALVERIQKLISRKWILLEYGNFMNNAAFNHARKFINSQYNPMLVEGSPERQALKSQLLAELKAERGEEVEPAKRPYARKTVEVADDSGR